MFEKLFFVVNESFTKYSSIICIVSSIGSIGWLFNKYWLNRQIFVSEQSLKGKTVLITGGNTGLGYETAKDILRRGARLILACRNLEKGEEAIEKLVNENQGDRKMIRLMKCDLSSLNSIRKFSEIYLNEEERLDILICNAGIGRSTDKFTEDHFDQIIQSNYLGHFLLTSLLLDKLRQCKPSRIINISSDLHQTVKSIDDWSDIFTQNKNSSLMGTYPQSKLFQILSTYQMKKDLFDEGINVYSLTPGWVSTSIGDPIEQTIGPFFSIFYRPFASLMKLFFAKTIKKGAETIIFCAVQPTLEQSKEIYFQNCQVSKPSSLAEDPQLAQRLTILTRQALQLE